MGAACHGLYRCLWAVRACSARWRALIRSWATPPMTGATFILRRVGLLQSNQPWIFAQLGSGVAAAVQRRQRFGGSAAAAARRWRCRGGSLAAAAPAAWRRWQFGGGMAAAAE